MRPCPASISRPNSSPRLRASALSSMLLCLLLPSLHADLKRAMAEPNLEKRSGLALDNAASALKAAREAYDKGDNDLAAKSAAEVQESVELAYTSLVQSGKNPRKSDWFKKAEIATRDLDRKIQAFQDSMSFTERPMLDKVKEAIEKVHEDILLGVMEGKKKK
jgi:Skp family chaperone for outer membrane proteins